jgi:hypothetical protein
MPSKRVKIATGSPHRIAVTRMYSDEFGHDLSIVWDDLSERILMWLSGDVLKDDRGEFLSLNVHIMVVVDDE